MDGVLDNEYAKMGSLGADEGSCLCGESRVLGLPFRVTEAAMEIGEKYVRYSEILALWALLEGSLSELDPLRIAFSPLQKRNCEHHVRAWRLRVRLNGVTQHPLLLGCPAATPFEATQRDGRRKAVG